MGLVATTSFGENSIFFFWLQIIVWREFKLLISSAICSSFSFFF